MGTLFNQSVRNRYNVGYADLVHEVEKLKEISAQTGIKLREVIEVYKVAELRRQTDAYISNGDIFDEQMAGIGELLDELISSIKKMKKK